MSSTPSAADLRESIESAAAASGISLDEHQRTAADALAAFGARVASAGTPSRGGGLYLWGTVGRGKTWLADALVAALPLERTRRRHFHSFYRDLQADLYREGVPEPGAIDAAIDALVRDVELLYFDEFHLHDAGDATLALRVLRRVIEGRVPLLATSNYPPEGLLPDPMFHHLFEPGVLLIANELEVVSLEGSTDYRRVERSDEHREGFARGSWQAHLPAPEPREDESVELRAGGRPVRARRADAADLWITFEELCERATAAADYLAWAERWRHWVIEAVPRLTECSPQARQRFLNLVDVLNDRGVPAVFVSELSPEQVLAGAPVPTARGAAADREEWGLGLDGLPIDVARTASRLALLQRPVAV
ncbi:cell division protein ZapE [Salinibacterium sp. SYSU T00001]|uniref:cell division protein ZapE n=1 Tax=Homoserinimonas sedimenticola TaxID=2986805 RepID=UPI0022369A22|nr:cell division protein ZapE [Salinibacterium sedimenticola]MCW4384753.1 cell division protein ZapE [Salinibacterium sedimenticola]